MKILKSGNKFEKGETINKNSQAEFKRKSVKRKIKKKMKKLKI